MNDSLSHSKDELPEAIRNALATTQARLFAGRAGTGYLTSTSLQLRADHAAARDAVYQEARLSRWFDQHWVERHNLFEVHTQASSRTEYLLRPDLGRCFNIETENVILKTCPAKPQVQIILGDGLSANALIQQGPPLLDGLTSLLTTDSLQIGQAFLVYNCRVGILNEIGRILQPTVVVLLIGERPGLAQSDSLSAYLAYHPQPGHTDAQRNLISNIHKNGVTIPEAADRILRLVKNMLLQQISGVSLKEVSTSRLIAT